MIRRWLALTYHLYALSHFILIRYKIDGLYQMRGFL